MIAVIIVAIMTTLAGIFAICGGISLLRENIRNKDDFDLFVGSILVCMAGTIVLCTGILCFFL